MKIIEIIKQKAAHIQINLLGSGQTLVEIIYEKVHPIFRTCMVVTFHWAALAIIYFHEDVSMQQVHQRLYYMITGEFISNSLFIRSWVRYGLIFLIMYFKSELMKNRVR